MKKTISTILIFILVIMLGVGIAYAYFAARIIGQEKASTISLTGGKMIIEYSENSGVIELSGIYPKADAWATKIITVKGTNSTNTTMKYDLGLNVIENTFRNSYISYDLKLIDGNNGTPISNITGKYINGTGYKRFGIGSFANANEEIHQYELKIYFKNNGKDQNDAQRAVFNAKVEIRDGGVDLPESEITMFLTGQQLNVKMKTLANLANNDETMPTTSTVNTTITAIKESLTEPTSENKEEKNIVSTTTSKYPIYMWYDDGIIYWWSEEKRPLLNNVLSALFRNMNNLSNISGIANWDSSQVANMAETFMNTRIDNLSALKTWDVSNLKNLLRCFSNTKIFSLEGLEDWNLSKIDSAVATFSFNNDLKDISALSNWDISSLKNMDSMFMGSGITSLESLKSWDTANVEIMKQLFASSSVNDIEGIRDWNVSKVESMEKIFYYTRSLTNASPINNWDISQNADFSLMFHGTPSHPEFTQIEGTWDNGTFIPNS